MIDINELHRGLKHSVESKREVLKDGELFLPKYLKGKVFVSEFKVVMRELASHLGNV
jgi:hypothetical protein